MNKYHLVFLRENGVWIMENGFVNRDCAKDEVECLRAHYKAKDLKIVTVSNNQKAIESAIKMMNEGV